MNNVLTPSLEKVLLNFISYSSLLGRSSYGEVLGQTLLLPEPERSEQLNILKYSISEILTLSEDHLEFREFVRKYDLSADNIKELLRFLGPDSGLKYYPDEEENVYVTLSSFLKTKIDEKLYDRLSLYIKLKFGRKYWEDIEYSEMKGENMSDVLKIIYAKSPKLAEYIYSYVK